MAFLTKPLGMGLSFGLTSGIITTLGLIMGLNAGTHSKLAIIGGILTIAVADAFSDALGMHAAEESENLKKTGDIWISCFATFISKFIFTLTFLVPIIFFDLSLSITICVIWGMFLLNILSYKVAEENQKSPIKTMLEHTAIAIIVIIITYYLGNWVSLKFK